jgi:hypothetical protein
LPRRVPALPRLSAAVLPVMLRAVLLMVRP